MCKIWKELWQNKRIYQGILMSEEMSERYEKYSDISDKKIECVRDVRDKSEDI